MRVDISEFDITNAPKTEMLQDQILRSLTGVDRFWFNILDAGMYPNGQELQYPMTKSDVYDIYVKTNTYPLTRNKFSRLIKKMFDKSFTPCKISGIQSIKFLSLDCARLSFETYSRLDINWDGEEPTNDFQIQLIEPVKKPVKKPVVKKLTVTKKVNKNAQLMSGLKRR